MTKLSRYTLVIIAILTASIVIPELYWIAFDKPNKVPYVQYSCILEDFAIYNSSEDTRTDPKGNSYTRDEYEKLLPLMYTRQLMMDNRLEDTIRGVATDMQTFNKARAYNRIRPNDFQAPAPQLYPLFESESGRATLEFPEDFFRINWRVEFINANTNSIDEAKSRTFSAALYQDGFQFPAKSISGIPTTRKSCDEGYLIIDADEQLFHLKLIKGKPYVKRVDLPKGVKFKHISCVDFKDKIFYAFLIAQDNSIYTLTQDVYQLVRWPINDYIAETQELKIQGDYFNYNITLTADDMQKSYALDKDLNVLDTYEYTWLARQDRVAGKISASLFPFEFSLTDSNSSFIRLYPKLSKGFIWIFVNLMFVLLQFYLIKKRQTKLFKQVIDLVLVALTGIFGFIAVNAFPNKVMK